MKIKWKISSKKKTKSIMRKSSKGKQLTTTTETGKTNKEVKIEFKWKINIY